MKFEYTNIVTFLVQEEYYLCVLHLQKEKSILEIEGTDRVIFNCTFSHFYFIV